MHFLALVVGRDVHEQLHPFADYTKVAPYRVELDDAEMSSMAEYFSLPSDDLEALVEKMPEWAGAEGEVRGGRLSYWTRENPHGRFDWYKIGGGYSGYLRLKEERKPSFLGRCFGKKPTDRADKALKRDVVLEHVITDPPFAIVAGGSWVEQGWSEDALPDEAWRQQVEERLRHVGEEETLTAVDVHS